MRIFYGTPENNIDVTEICYRDLCKNNIIEIPPCDVIRAGYFTDCALGILKQIFISENESKENTLIFDSNTSIQIDIASGIITTITEDDIVNKLLLLHKQLQLNYGSFYEEFPEQKMATRYLKGNEKVLEIGGNVGRNSLIIAHLLGYNATNFVTLESDSHIASQLRENRDANNMQFHIENSALSKRKLIQKGWETFVSDEVMDGYHTVPTITWDELKAKYNIEFDTLVLDCEGAFYYILQDMPEILDNINLIIMENDYKDFSHKLYLDDMLRKNNFRIDYSESGGWDPCYHNFFEVWKRN